MLKHIRRLERKLGRPIEMLLRFTVFAILASYYLLLLLTLRIDEVGADIPQQLKKNKQYFVVSTWHGRLLMIGLVARRRIGGRLLAFNSPHLDGRLLAWMHGLLAIKTVYGAPNKNPERGMVNLLKHHKKHPSHLLITPDGPRGPRQKVKRGVIAFAKLSGTPIIPVGFAPYSGLMLKSWDRFILPLPFTKLVTIWGEPMLLDKNASKEKEEQVRLELEAQMNALMAQADQRANRVSPNSAD